MFTSGHAYWHAELAKNEQRHLESILYQLRNMSEEVPAQHGARTAEDRVWTASVMLLVFRRFHRNNTHIL